MITTKLHQQYANHLYMIATTIATAKRHGHDYCIPTHGQKYPTYQYKNVKYADIELPMFKEDERKFNIIPDTDNICLYGYWQDTNYFMDHWDDILDALAFDWKLNEGKVSIHVRRGDYLKHPLHFPSVSLEYVKNGIEHFKNLGYNDFTFFSDDIAWGKENVTKEKFGVNIEYSEGRHPIDDLQFMSMHEHQIVANSTYSVWAAYLNRNPNKIVVRPPFFLGVKSKHLHKNIYLPDWIIKEN